MHLLLYNYLSFGLRRDGGRRERSSDGVHAREERAVNVNIRSDCIIKYGRSARQSHLGEDDCGQPLFRIALSNSEEPPHFEFILIMAISTCSRPALPTIWHSTSCQGLSPGNMPLHPSPFLLILIAFAYGLLHAKAFPIHLSRKHNVQCWEQIIAFILVNYVTHVMTIKSIPNEKPGATIIYNIATIPITSFHRSSKRNSSDF